VESATQFSVFLPNKPGVLAQVSRQLAQAKINIIAMTIMDASEHGVLRLVVSDPQRLRSAMAPLNLPVTETEVLVVEMSNRPGALAAAGSPRPMSTSATLTVRRERRAAGPRASSRSPTRRKP
jgi:hypothetical protein